MAADPIHQFRIIDLFPVAKIGHTEIVFTNSAAFMLAAVVVITAFLIIGTARRGLVPSRLQSAAELSYEFVASTVRSTVFLTVLIYGLWRHGLHFFNLFVPKGVPIYILPLIVFIEILSFVSRPISHSVRLFANMLAGHITLQVFAGFIILMGGAMGALGWAGGVLPFAMIVILFALETLVAFLQAYVFAILTCIYLNDAIHPGH
jgi:F-type H+-transporting ATPase subunit a